MRGKLILQDGTVFEGESFGFIKSVPGEAVFVTGMVGYPEGITDPSYKGQILINTYPIIGNYGVPPKSEWESDKIQISALIVSQYVDTPSHHSSHMTLSEWLVKEEIPALEVKDTRLLAQKIREKGAMLGKVVFDKDIEFHDPNKDNLVNEVSVKKPVIIGEGKKTIAVMDCGVKKNTINVLIEKGYKVARIPWNYDFFESDIKIDGLLLSNGPGDPKSAKETIAIAKKAMERKLPILGICLGNQVLTLAAGGDTFKLKFGHRGQNQPCILYGTKKAFLTTQNHGFAVSRIPKGFKPWFINANDGTNEGIIHDKLPFMSVQFHPESTPGPLDTMWVFDYFLDKVENEK